MSIQRARINCRRCYELAKVYSVDQLLASTHEKAGNLVFHIRNEAMLALEEVRVIGKIQFDWKLAYDALTACESCDYKSPKIFQFTEDWMKKEITKYLKSKKLKT